MALVMNTSLTDALASRIQPKLVDIGWSIGGEDSSPLSEYICLMLVNGKNQEQIASELSGDLLGLGPDDPSATEFSKWLFEQVEALGSKVPQEKIKVEESPQSEKETLRINGNSGDHEMGDSMDVEPQDGVPTAPKAMRQPGQPHARRLMNQLFKAMERKPDDPLHRVRPEASAARIDTHRREPPKGPSKGPMRGGMNSRPHQQRMNGRNGFGPHNSAFTNMNPQQQMQFYHMYQQQSQLMAPFMPGQPPQQHMGMPMPGPMNGPMSGMGGPMGSPIGGPLGGPMGGPMGGPLGGPMGRPMGTQMGTQMGAQMGGPMHHQIPMGMPMGPEDPYQNNLSQPRRAGGSLFDRIQVPPEVPQQNGGMDTTEDMAVDHKSPGAQGPQTPPSSKPEELVCKFGSGCTRPECPYGHPAPAAFPGRGTTYVSGEKCPFGATCKNRKCTGSHPSPAAAATRPAVPKPDQECKFFPNCTNPTCPYKHPSITMPLCRNGASCTRPGCHFTHAEVKCKFTPCLNPVCIYKHDEGQQKGSFDHKVWTATGKRSHVSDRKFVSGEEGEEELIIPGQGLPGETEKDMDTAPVDEIE